MVWSRDHEPYDDPDGTIRLRNCPFDRIAADHRQLVCGANHALLHALTDQVDGSVDQLAGVNLDEEMANLVVAQRGYEAASRVVSVLDSMLDTLINRMAI